MDSDGRDQHPTDADSTTHYVPENPRLSPEDAIYPAYAAGAAGAFA